MRLVNLDDNGLRELLGRVSVLETANPLQAASVDSGRVRIGGTATFLVDASGGIIVHGLLNGDGTFTWSGPLNLSGTQTVTGILNVNGPFNLAGTGGITGSLSITGPTSISGVLTLLNNLAIGSGGTITVGNMVIDPALTGGGAIGGMSAPVAIMLSTPSVIASANLSVNSDLFVNGVLTNVGMPPITTATNVGVSAGGKLQRITSASRFKIDPQPMDLPDALLDVPVKDWIDRGSHERGENIPRVPGVIAEEVEAAGGELFVSYDEEGLIQGVGYDRFALARTQILARQLSASNKKLDEALELIQTLTVRFDNQSDNCKCGHHDI